MNTLYTSHMHIWTLRMFALRLFVCSLSKLSWVCQFGVACSLSISWHVLGGVSDQFVIPSWLCVLPAVRPWSCATLILEAPGDTAKCSTHSTLGQIKDSAYWSSSLRERNRRTRFAFSFAPEKSSSTRMCVTRYSTALSELCRVSAVMWRLIFENVNWYLVTLNNSSAIEFYEENNSLLLFPFGTNILILV